MDGNDKAKITGFALIYRLFPYWSIDCKSGEGMFLLTNQEREGLGG